MNLPDCAADIAVECSLNKPCALCLKREQYASVFVAVDSEGNSTGRTGPLCNFVCGHCIPTHSPPIDVADDNTQVWRLDSDGWLGAIECMDCGESIPVEPDEADDEITEVIPDMDERVRAMHEASNG